jgi:hypothetical protein
MTHTPYLRRTTLACLSTLLMGAFCTPSVAEESAPEVEPPGMDKSTKTQALEMGAKVLQSTAPLTGMDLYLVGFHPLKDEPQSS